MNIGQASIATGVSTKMIRYYERIGLIRSADRSLGNYRRFDEADVRELHFIRGARALGYSVDAIAELLALWRMERPAAEVATRSAQLASQVSARLEGLQALKTALEDLITAAGEGRVLPCPVLPAFDPSFAPRND